MKTSISEVDRTPLPAVSSGQTLQITPGDDSVTQLLQRTQSPLSSIAGTRFLSSLSGQLHEPTSSSQKELSFSTDRPLFASPTLQPPRIDEYKGPVGAQGHINNPSKDLASASSTPLISTPFMDSSANSHGPPTFLSDHSNTTSMPHNLATSSASDKDTGARNSNISLMSNPSPLSALQGSDTLPKSTSPQLENNSLKPQLPIFSASTPLNARSLLPSDEPTPSQLPELSDKSSFSPSSVIERSNTVPSDVLSSPNVPIPSRSLQHTSDTLNDLPKRSNKPANLNLLSATARDFKADSQNPPLTGESSIGMVKQVNLLTPGNRSSSAPSTPGPVSSAKSGQEEGKGRAVSSSMSPAYPSIDNYSYKELKVLLSEKLIQLSQVQSQNAQLWTLVNKQRTMIFDLQKDLDGAVEQNEKYRAMLAKQSSLPLDSPVEASMSLDPNTESKVKDAQPNPSKSSAPVNSTSLLPVEVPSPNSISSSVSMEGAEANNQGSVKSKSVGDQSKASTGPDIDNSAASIVSVPSTREVSISPMPPTEPQADQKSIASSKAGTSIPLSKSSFDFTNLNHTPSMSSVCCLIFLDANLTFILGIFSD